MKRFIGTKYIGYLAEMVGGQKFGTTQVKTNARRFKDAGEVTQFLFDNQLRWKFELETLTKKELETK